MRQLGCYIFFNEILYELTYKISLKTVLQPSCLSPYILYTTHYSHKTKNILID